MGQRQYCYRQQLRGRLLGFLPHRGDTLHRWGEIVNWLQKTATRNGNLQLEIETNEYSSSKKLLE